MSVSIEHSNGELVADGSANSSGDQQWLQSLNFRHSLVAKLLQDPAESSYEEFVQALTTLPHPADELKKSDCKRIVAQIQQLRESDCSVDAVIGLSTALLDDKLKKGERSALVDAFIAGHGEDKADNVSLTDALWILTVRRQQLETETFFSLWRWTLQRGQEWMAARPVCDPDQGFSQLRFLEICYFMATTFQELKGSRKLLKETTGLIRSCLDAATDNDGTPQPQWLPTLVESLSCLARISTFAEVCSQKLWNKSYQTRLTGLLERSLSLCSPQHHAFALSNTSLDLGRLDAIAAALGESQDSGLRRLIRSWSNASAPSTKKVSDWHLPEETHQSDWASLACLRSGWASPVDQCVVIHDSMSLQLDVVVADQPLFMGAWKHELKLDGKSVRGVDEWVCSCWFADAEVNFMELIQDVGNEARVVRQVILDREHHQLVLNHAVHAPDAMKIAYRASLPFAGDWTVEADSATRELALSTGSVSVRVYPLSLPQDRVTKADGSLITTATHFTAEQQIEGDRLFASTVFDWSPKHARKPVDWTRLTVAQNGQLEPHHQAAAFRYRVGKDQRLLYHSLAEPEIPRTVLGLHTDKETVFAKLTTKGEFAPIVEVEVS